jgi:hypothetical protein
MTRSAFLLAAFLMPLACGGDDKGDDGGNDSNNSSATEGSGAMTTAQTQTTSTMEECNTSHQCIGGACTCTTPGLENMACTDDTACEEECEICM